MGDIERGLKAGVPKQELYQELSKIADKSRNKNDSVSEVVKKGLKKVADEIHETGK